MLSRRQLLISAAGAAATSALGIGTVYYTLYIEPHWVDVAKVSMPVKNLPPDLEGRTLVQLSDIHVGRRVSDDYLLSVFDRVRAMEPDIVALTGDFVSHHGGIVDQAAKVYPHLPRGKLASVGIFGNHDYGRRWADLYLNERLHDVFESAGISMLQNQAVDVEGLRLIGLDDRWGPFFDPDPIMATVDAGDPAIVLTHNPDTADMPFWGAFDGWILAGHTHGGQCKPPFFRPPILPVKNTRYIAGRYDLSSDRTLYINRGIGHLLKARFNARPEITVFTLQRAAGGSTVGSDMRV